RVGQLPGSAGHRLGLAGRPGGDRPPLSWSRPPARSAFLGQRPRGGSVRRAGPGSERSHLRSRSSPSGVGQKARTRRFGRGRLRAAGALARARDDSAQTTGSERDPSVSVGGDVMPERTRRMIAAGLAAAAEAGLIFLPLMQLSSESARASDGPLGSYAIFVPLYVLGVVAWTA